MSGQLLRSGLSRVLRFRLLKELAVGGDTADPTKQFRWRVARGTAGAQTHVITLYVVEEALPQEESGSAPVFATATEWHGYGPAGTDLQAYDVITSEATPTLTFQVMHVGTTDGDVDARLEATGGP